MNVLKLVGKGVQNMNEYKERKNMGPMYELWTYTYGRTENSNQYFGN